MSVVAAARPYVSLFASRFQLLLQYRGAAFAGFITQCWWGGLKVMILVAFYSTANAASAPMTLQQAITYTWVAQGLLAMLPWLGDPDIANAVRTGAVSYDRLRPLDFYGLWYSRTAGWICARMVPRFLLMFVFAAVLLPIAGFADWGWQPPASFLAGVIFAASLILALLLSAAMVMLLNIGVAALLNPRGVNALVAAPVVVLSGNLLPLALLPDWMQTALLVQPLAGVLDIPLRIYFAQLSDWGALAGLGLQAFWLVALVVIGRWAIARVLRTLEMQGG